MRRGEGPGPRDAARDAYHHGNLREALVAACLRLIAERGPAGFAFAEVARAAGVSAAAPYRHFRDRNALLAEVARQGFERLGDALAAAWADGRAGPAPGLEACGRAYLAFARREPAAWAAMFESGLPPEREPALLAASDRCLGVLRGAAEALCAAAQAGGRGAPRPPPLMVALHVWSLSHGVAALFVAGEGGPRRRLPMTPEQLLEAGLLLYLQSLGLHG